MSKRGKDTAGLIMRKGPKGLMPVSAFDFEQLSGFALGTEFAVKCLTRRSLPQHRTYWKALTAVAQATEMWPTAEHLHDALKRDLGYVEAVTGLDGRTFERPGSTAFDEMDQAAFQVYFDKAMQRIAEATGCDPLWWLADDRSAA